MSADELETRRRVPRRGPARGSGEHLEPVGPILVSLARRTAPTRRSWRPSRATASCSACCSTPAWPGSASRPSTAARASRPRTSRSLNEELDGYEYPMRFQVPTFNPCAAVLLDFGTEEQKQRHIPAILKGEEIWMQFLSEPSGGSDVAGALTTAVRDGDEWILNGSKVWTTGAWWSDWGLCLARTNWDVPKHRGLTVFMFPIDQEGIEVHRIEMLNGNKEFCQEFLTDVRRARHRPHRRGGRRLDRRHPVDVPRAHALQLAATSPSRRAPGAATTRRRWSRWPATPAASTTRWPATWSARRGRSTLVGDALRRRIGEGIATDAWPTRPRPSAASSAASRRCGAPRSGSRSPGRPGRRGRTGTTSAGIGTDFLMRQVSCIGGGTTEMARNVVSERVLGHAARPDVGPGRRVPRRPAQRVARLSRGRERPTLSGWWGSRGRWRSTTGRASAS